MGYPGTYRSGSAKYGRGGYQRPLPTRSSGSPPRPANDNMPPPANDNFPPLPSNTPGRLGNVAKGVMRRLPWIGVAVTLADLVSDWSRVNTRDDGYIGSWTKCWSCSPDLSAYPLKWAYSNSWSSCPPAWLCGVGNQGFNATSWNGSWGFIRGQYYADPGGARAKWTEAWVRTKAETQAPREPSVVPKWVPVAPRQNPIWRYPGWDPGALPILQPVPTPRPVPYPEIPRRPEGDGMDSSSRGNYPPRGRIDMPPDYGMTPSAWGGLPRGRRPPGPREKEKKFRTSPRNSMLITNLVNAARAYGWLDDLKDYWLALHRSLPKKYRSKTNDLPSKIKAVYDHFEEIDWNKASDELMQEIMEDMLGRFSEILRQDVARRNSWFKTKVNVSVPH